MSSSELEKVEEIILDAMNGLEALAVDVKHKIAEIKQADTVREVSFTILTWTPKKGERLGEFEIATKDSNDPEKYQHALNILKQNRATIEERFHEPQYTHTYWTYQDTIYRQVRKPKQ